MVLGPTGVIQITLLSAILSRKTDNWHVWQFTQLPLLWFYKQCISGHLKWAGRSLKGGKCDGVNLLLKISQVGFSCGTWGTVRVVHPIFMNPWYNIEQVTWQCSHHRPRSPYSPIRGSWRWGVLLSQYPMSHTKILLVIFLATSLPHHICTPLMICQPNCGDHRYTVYNIKEGEVK